MAPKRDDLDRSNRTDEFDDFELLTKLVGSDTAIAIDEVLEEISIESFLMK